MIFYKHCHVVLIFAGMLGIYARSANAQLQEQLQQLTISVPLVPFTAIGTSTRPISAGEAATHTAAKQIENETKLSFRDVHYPIDSMRAVVAATSKQWLSRIPQETVVGIQLDPSVRIGVAAEQEAYAKTQINARLSTPNLSFGDKAYTLRTAVSAFTNVYTPSRLPVAEMYLRQLDALGDSAAAWQFEARATLLWTYYLLGRSEDVVRHGIRAIELVGIMPFANRNLMFGQSEERIYSPTVEALTGQPNSRAKIERINQILRAATIPSPGLVAQDVNYRYYGEQMQQSAERFIQGNAKLGMPAAPLVAHHWLNRPSPDSATIPLNDGRIHLIEVAHTGCLPCVYELYALERIYKIFPEIEPMLLTWTFGYWGNQLVESVEEVQNLTDYFVTKTKVTFPVGIWAGKKVPNDDGGLTPEEAPNLKDYPLLGKPMLWVVDGNGMIRRVFTGYDREIETQIIHTVEFLIRESKSRS